MSGGLVLRVRPAALAGAAVALALLALHAWRFHFVIDDAWISLRYARNLVEGHGLVFNPGEPVEGYSNLLWVLLGAAGLKLGIEPVAWLRVLGTLAMGALLLLVPGALERLQGDRRAPGRWAAPTAQLLVAALGPVACWMWGGLETPLFALLVFAAWRGALARRTLTTGVLGVLLVLTRPEGLALGALFGAWSLLPGDGLRPAEGRNLRRWLGPAAFVAGTALYLLWRHHTYGWWLPNTYYAKTGDLGGQLRTGWPYARDVLLRFGLPLGLAGAAALPRVGPTALVRRPVALTLGLLLLWLGYTTAVGGDSLGMFRFHAPMLPVGVVLVVALLSEAGWLQRPLPSALVAVPLAAVLLVSSVQGRERRLVAMHMSEANLGGWILAGDALAAQLPPGTTIALGPAGYIPWRTNFRTYDFYGIVTPAIAHRDVEFRQGYAGHEKTDGRWIVQRRPDYILVGNVCITDRPLESLIKPHRRELDIVLDPAFQQEYEQVWLPVAGGKALNLFRRKDLD
ncbi:MAG TPA: hypothetical protein PLQ13_12735 [Candidatus Krumholzibacteria bacterium]|nr:hypothetical protein [Candidatus Krumholzibacteria bacterium]